LARQFNHVTAMRSTVLTVGNQVKHLRYPFSVVEDLEQILPNGFYSIFDMEAELPTCHLLLWAGLQHEGVSYQESGVYLISEGAAYDPIVLIGFWKKITDALTLDKWISIGTQKDKGKGDDGDPVPLSETIADMERIALSELNISSAEFYGLTPREFELMREHAGLRDNTRTGLVCATIANCSVPKKDSRPWAPEDFIRTGRKPKVQSVDDQIALFNAAMGGS